ncbi:MAG TPA: hypothetical protein VFV02_14010 [Acidimicrobiales bacterium]|nr:hypothetical protein [Acidimicrobiales bacterium]
MTVADVVGVGAAVVEDVFDDELELQAERPAAATNAMGTSRFTVSYSPLVGDARMVTQQDELLVTGKWLRT